MALVIAFLALAGEAPGQQMPVPVDVQIPVLLKVLSFDRRIADARGQILVVGVLYQSGYRASATAKDRAVEEFTRARSSGPASRSLALVQIDADKESALEKALTRLGVRVLYVTPVRAFDLDSLVAATRRNGILTLTGVPEYVEAGVSIGVELRQDRPRILVNLRAARAEGADLAAQLLGLATVVEGRGGPP
jgi:D-arabinose 1-dehydrogenase-like Zn-dependent alcohol dehydrogenase